MKYINIFVLVVCIILLLPNIINYSIAFDDNGISIEPNHLSTFQKVYNQIRNEWVGEVSEKELIDAAIQAMFELLDQHSNYVDPQEFESLRISNSGNFVGIGTEITKDEQTGYIKIVTVFEDGPAFHAGLKSGDLITAVDSKSTKTRNENDVSVSQVSGWIRGEENTIVQLTISRNDGDEIFGILLTRKKIELVPVRTTLIEDNIIYMEVKNFSGNVSVKLEKALFEAIDQIAEIESQNTNSLSGIIIDLRNNPGGLLRESIKMTNLFVSDGNIVHTRGRTGEIQNSWDANRYIAVREDIPIVVLINGRSASAAEILTGALKDLNRATVVGENSYGKGSVQTIYTLDNGHAVRLTTSYYYTALDNRIDGIGISPDITIASPENYSKKNWFDIDPQMQVAIMVIRSTHNSECSYSAILDSSNTQYDLIENCP